MPFYKWFTFTAFFFLFHSVAHADTFFEINERQSKVPLGEHISYYEDVSHSLTFDSIQALSSNAWQRNDKQQVSFGYSESSYWIKFSVKNLGSKMLDRIIEIGYPVLDYVDVHIVRDGEYTNHIKMGDKLPFYERLIQNRNFLVPVRIDVGEKLDVYIKIKTTSSMQAPIDIWNPIDFHQVDQSRIIFQGVYFGIALVMILYNLFVYLAVSEKTYLHYVGYITCMPMFLGSLNGLNFQYLWPTATWWNDQSIVFFLNGVMMFGSFFAIRFLSMKPTTHRFMNRYMTSIAWLAGIMMFCSLLFTYRTMIQPTIIVGLVACMSLLVFGIYRWVEGDISARYFTVAWTAMLSGGIVLALNKFTLLPQNVVTESATQIGSALEIILLSIALADRLNQEKRKAFNAQLEALEHERDARKAQEETLKVQKEANAMLEQRVNERTSELERLNAQLLELSATDALTGLKNRGYFDEQFQHYYTTAYRLRQSLSILVIDIDHFKKFNDNYGHLVGDECLVMVSDSINFVVSRPEDITCRYGGEEFVVLLPNTDQQGAIQVAEKIRAKVSSELFQVADESLKITVSIGTNTMTPAQSNNRSVMFEQADEALYKSKESGRNRVTCFQAEPA